MRMIDADALIKDIEIVGKSVMFTSHHERMVHDDKIEFAIDAIEKAPTIEAELVRHGEWKEWWPGSCALIMTGEEMLWECSECGAKYADKENMNYCPRCGERMDGGTSDGSTDK